MEFYVKESAKIALKKIGNLADLNNGSIDLTAGQRNTESFPPVSAITASKGGKRIVLIQFHKSLRISFLEETQGCFPFLLQDTLHISGVMETISRYTLFTENARRVNIHHYNLVEFSNILLSYFGKYYIDMNSEEPAPDCFHINAIRLLFAEIYSKLQNVLNWNAENFELTPKGMKFLVHTLIFKGIIEIEFKQLPNLFFVHRHPEGYKSIYSKDEVYTHKFIDYINKKICKI